MSWHPEDPSYTIFLKDKKPGYNKGGAYRYVRDLFNCGISQARDYVENLPEQPIGVVKSELISQKEAETIARSIVEELDRLGIVADWDYSYGDMM